MLWFPSNLTEVQVAKDWAIERLDGFAVDTYSDGYPVVIVRQLSDGDAVIRAVMIYTNHTGNNVFIVGASDSDGFMGPTDVALVLAVPFNPPMNVLRVTALVSETNKRSVRLMECFGFQLEGILRDYEAEGSKTLVYGLTKSDFLGGRYGRKAAAAGRKPNWNDAREWAADEPVCMELRSAQGCPS